MTAPSRNWKFQSPQKTDLNQCFQLLIPTSTQSRIVVRCYDDLGWDSAGRIKLTYEVRYAGEIIFPRGQLYSAVHCASDSDEAKAHVLSHLAMHPGDGSGVDDEFYAGYTEQQLDFVITHGETIEMIRDERYCDPETGEVKRRDR